MNLHGVVLAAYRAFCKESSDFTKGEAARLLSQAVNSAPCNDNFTCHFRDSTGQSYTVHLYGHELAGHLEAKFKSTEHRLIAIIQA